MMSLLIFFDFNQVVAQDHHFTLVNLAPVRMNPALSGMFEPAFKNKDVRMLGHYRDQWRSISSPWTSRQTPFATSLVAIDGQIKLHKIAHGDYAGWGVQLLNDKSGDLRLTTNEITLSLAFHKMLNHQGTSYLSLGGSYIISMRKVDLSEGVFDNQWNGVSFDPSLSTGEYFENTQFRFSDYTAGIAYNYIPPLGTQFNIGYSIHHLTQPYQTFYASNNDNRLHFNNIAHADVELPLTNKNKSVVLNAFAQSQAKANELKILAYYKVKMEHQFHLKQALQVGVGIREVGNFRKEIKGDAFFVASRYYYGDFVFSAAYDVNFSRLSAATSSIGAFEINVVYYRDMYRPNVKPHKRAGDYRPHCPEIK